MKNNIDRCDYSENREWADSYMPVIFEVLKRNAGGFLVALNVAPLKIDTKEVGDIVVESTMGHIAVRIRRPDVIYRDFTVRTRSENGGKTELDKIREGLGKWYFYGWAAGEMPYGNGQLKDWVFLDLDIFRNSGLAFDDNRREIPNKDGKTKFYAFNDEELLYADCIVARHNERLNSCPDGWTNWHDLRLWYGRSVDFEEIPITQARVGDIISFYSADKKKMQVGIIKGFSDDLVQIGRTIWTYIESSVRETKIFKVR